MSSPSRPGLAGNWPIDSTSPSSSRPGSASKLIRLHSNRNPVHDRLVQRHLGFSSEKVGEKEQLLPLRTDIPSSTMTWFLPRPFGSL